MQEFKFLLRLATSGLALLCLLFAFGALLTPETMASESRRAALRNWAVVALGYVFYFVLWHF